MVKSLRSSADSALFLAIGETFTRMGWVSRRVAGREVLEADFELHHTKARVHAQAFPELNALSVVTQSGHRVPDSRSGLISEMLMRTNKDLTIGNFELDYDDGTVMFRATNIFPPGGAHGQIIASLVHCALAELDRITPFLTLVLRMGNEELAGLNLKTFLMREDLLPPMPEESQDL